jgi:hypothetical protein
MRIASNVLGICLLIVGCIWLLQGINVIQGSFMTGQKTWVVIGGLVLIIGIGIMISANRRRV